MEMPDSSATLPSNGCADPSLSIQEKKSDIPSNNAHPFLASSAALNEESNSTMCKKKRQDGKVLVDTEDHTKYGHKRKFSEDEKVYKNAESSYKITKYEMPNGLTQQLPCQSEVTPSTTLQNINKFPRKKHKVKKSLWIMSCDRCSFETNSMNEFTHHIDNIHPNLNDFKCHKCSFATTSSSLLNKHDRYDHSDEECTGANPLSKDKSEVDDAGTLGPDSLPINCPQPSEAIHRLHEITETEEGESQCPYCQYTNIATESVKDHMNVFHERRKWYGCPFCQLNSSCRRTMIHHLKKKHDLVINDVFLDAILLSINENMERNTKEISNDNGEVLVVPNASINELSLVESPATPSLKNSSIKLNSNRKIRSGILYVEEKHKKPCIELPRDENVGTINFQCPYCGVIRTSKCSIAIHMNAMHEMKDWFICKESGCSFTQLYASLISTHYKETHGISKAITDVSIDCKITDNSLLKKLTAEKVTYEKSYDPSNEVTIKCHQINHSIVKHKKGSILSQVDQQTDDAILKIMDQDHDSIFSYQCPHCDLAFENRKKTLLHATLVHIMKWFKCLACSTVVHYTKNLTVHLQKQHHMIRNSSEVVESMQMHDEQEINTIAEQKIKLEMEWEESIESEEGARIAECNQTIMAPNGDKPNTKTHIIDLEKRVNLEDDPKYKCPDCDVISKYKQNIKSHLKTVHKKTSTEIFEKITTENLTDKDSSGRKSNTIDIDEIMQGGIYNLSKLCIDSLSDLIEEFHESNYADVEKRYKCRVCKMVSKYKRHVLTHIKNVHGKVKKYYCQICDFLHASPNQLKNHYEEVHIIEHTIGDVIDRMQLPKEKSGKTYKIPPTLTLETALQEDIPIDMKIQQSGKWYQCPYCTFTRKLEHVIVLHINAFHKMTKWYKCSICKEAMLYAHSLLFHLKEMHNITQSAKEVTDMFVKDENEIRKLRDNRLGLGSNETTTKRALREGSYSRRSYAEVPDEDSKSAGPKTPVKDELREDVKPQIRKLYEDMRKGEHPIKSFEDPKGAYDPKTGEKITWYKCPVCSKTMREEINVQRHINFLHTMNNWYKCDQCGAAKLDSFMLRSHFMDEHNISRTIKSIENELFIRDENELRNLKEAKIKSRIDKFIKVSKGKEPMELNGRREGSKRQGHSIKQSPCFRDTSSARRRSLEKEEFESTGRQSYKCSFCDTIIKDKYNLNRHINALHTMTKWYKCNKCDETTLYRNNHIHHMRRVHDIDASSAQVDKTMIVIDEEEVMQLREEKIKSIQNATVLYRCSDCDIAELDPHNLVVHLTKQHSLTKTVAEVQRGMNIVQRNGLTGLQKMGDFSCSQVTIASPRRNLKRPFIPAKRKKGSRSSSSGSGSSSSESSSSSSDESSGEEKDEDKNSVQLKISCDNNKNQSTKKPGTSSNGSTKEKTELTCSYCDKELMSQDVFEDHVNSQHEKEYCYKCTECDFVGFWARGMKLHLYNKHHIFVEQDDVVEHYKCKDKNLIENVGKKDRKGVVTKASRPSRPSKSARRKSTQMEPKKKEAHQKLVPVAKEKQKSVVEKCDDDGKKYYVCPYCSVESAIVRNIKDHVNSKHEYSSWYKCFECDFISFWTSSIRDHLSEQHNNHLASFQEIDTKCLFSNQNNADEKMDQKSQTHISNVHEDTNAVKTDPNVSPTEVVDDINMGDLWKEEMNGVNDTKMIPAENANDGEGSHSLRRSRKVVSYKEDNFDYEDPMSSKIKLLSAWTRLPSSSQQQTINSTNAHSPRKERKERKDLLCPYCEKDLLNKENYEGHINAKHEKKFCYKCPVSVCNYVSLWRKGFREHLLHSHKIEQKNNEEIDNKYKNYERNLIDRVRHKRTSDEMSQERGENDDTILGAEQDGKKMDSNSHPVTADPSSIIATPISNDSSLQSAVEVCKSKNGQEDVDGKMFSGAVSMELEPLTCKKCKESFTKENLWASHMENVHGIPQILLLCPECDFESQDKQCFKNHLVKTHAYETINMKSISLKQLNELDEYQVTMKEKTPFIRTEKNQRPQCKNANGEYICPRCDYTYETVNLLEAHCREGHGPQTWYSCPCCPYENRDLRCVREHISKKHGTSSSNWSSNLEGRKIDKSRFIQNELRSTSSSIPSTLTSKKNPNPTQVFLAHGLSNNIKSEYTHEINKNENNGDEGSLTLKIEIDDQLPND